MHLTVTSSLVLWDQLGIRPLMDSVTEFNCLKYPVHSNAQEMHPSQPVSLPTSSWVTVLGSHSRSSFMLLPPNTVSEPRRSLRAPAQPSPVLVALKSYPEFKSLTRRSGTFGDFL